VCGKRLKMLKLISFAVFLFLGLACSKSTSDLVLGSWGDAGDKLTFREDGKVEFWEIRNEVWVKYNVYEWDVVDGEIHIFDVEKGNTFASVCKIDEGSEGEVKFLPRVAEIRDGVRKDTRPETDWFRITE
jgi:hypothetical protein